MKKRASDDIELFIRLQGDDDKALEGFYKLYSDSIYLLAYRLLDNADEAKDATSTAFTRLWWERKDLCDARHLQGFLVTVTRNYCIDQLRKRKLTSRMVHYTVKDPSSGISPYPADLKLIRSEISAQIYKEVKKLPSKKLQDVFVLRFIEQKEPVEIAKMLAISVKSVYNYTEDARRRMKSLLLDKGIDLSYALLILSFSIKHILELIY